MATLASIHGASYPTANPLLLPRELQMKTMNLLLPPAGVRVTSPESWGDAPQLDRAFLESRSALCSLCQVSRHSNALATSFLYKIVLLRNRKDLLCFFRTLLSAQHLRPLVSSLVWVGVLSGLGALVQGIAQVSEAVEDEEMDQVASQSWTGIDWPPESADDISIIRRMNLDPSNTLTFRHFQVFGAILGMTSRIESLFTILGCVSPGVLGGGWYPECPELLGLERLLAPAQWMYGEHESIDATDLPNTSARALQSLRTITLEAHSEHDTQINPPTLVLRLVLEFCPCLERIEIKAMNHWRIMLTDRESDQVKTKWIHRNVKELILRRACWPQSSLPIIGLAFPNLRRFYAEWGSGSNSLSPDRSWQTDRDICIGLSKLKRTLEVLHLTTLPGCSWERSDFPSLLFPTLGQMTALNHLTTECLWLFGQTDPFSLDVESLLPPSLISLHLVDYWGTSDRERYYPNFPDDSSPLDFLKRFMQHLHLGCYSALSELKAVRLTSPLFSSFVSGTTEHSSSGNGHQRDIQVFIDNFSQSFSTVGVDFSVAPYDSLEENGQWQWSRISSSPLIF